MNKDNVKIRKAKISDTQILSQLVISLSHYYLSDKTNQLPNWLVDSFTEKQFLARINSPEYVHFVAEVNNRIIGFIVIKQPNHLYHLFVHECYHGQGIGRQLWQYAYHKLQLDSQKNIIVRASLYAVPIYERFGFIRADNILEKDGLKFLPMQKNQNS